MLNTQLLDSVTNYTIYLKNDSNDGKNFWCFLEKPVGVPDGAVFANSSASLFVEPSYPGENSFIIPLQYSLAAGATNKEVGLGVQIKTSHIIEAQLRQTWEAEYATVPPNKGPRLSLVQGEKSPEKTIGALSNSFNKTKNEDNKWYSSMSFGIQTQNGFLGVTWSPSPGDKHTITPKFSFYIATGSYTSYELADIATISRNSAKIEISTFKNLEATVTLTDTGEWIVTPGKVE